MTAFVRWTPKARVDVLEIADYLAQPKQLSTAREIP
jgi:plasmid stabilization system protein ParE